MNSPSHSSAAPYVSAVSIRLPPASRKAVTIFWLAARDEPHFCPVAFAQLPLARKPIVPRQRVDTLSPDLPSNVYCIVLAPETPPRYGSVPVRPLLPAFSTLAAGADEL